MKKALFFSLFLSFKLLGQSVTIEPETIRKKDSNKEDINIQTYEKAPSIIGFRANGSSANQQVVNATDVIMLIGGRGYNGSNISLPNISYANIKFKSSQKWTPSASGSSINFETTANNTSGALERMIINHDGKVGIGVSNPNQILDINGRARIRHNGNTAGIWMNNTANGLTESDGAFYGMKSDTTAGIWLANDWRFWVSNVGIISASSLVGTGNRPLVTNSNGGIKADTQLHQYFLQSSDFQPQNGSSTIYRAQNSLVFESVGTIVAPLHLPPGAIVTDIKIRGIDNSNTGEIRYSLEECLVDCVSIQNYGTSIVGNSSTIATYSFSPFAPISLDENRIYNLKVTAVDGSNNHLSWVLGSTFLLSFIQITYHY